MNVRDTETARRVAPVVAERLSHPGMPVAVASVERDDDSPTWRVRVEWPPNYVAVAVGRDLLTVCRSAIALAGAERLRQRSAS